MKEPSLSNLFFAALMTIQFLALANDVSAATYSTNSFSDSFVTTGPSGNLSGNNYGGAGALSVAAAGLSKGEFQSVLQFDLGGARNAFDNQFGAGQWSLQSATLTLTATPTNNGIFNATAAGQFNVYWMQNDSWQEGTGTPQTPTTTGITFTSLMNTYTNAADELLGTFSFNGAANGQAIYTLSLMPAFSSDLLAGGLISFRMSAADTGVSYLFNSRNFGVAGSRPSLSVSAVPEPGVAGLAAMGLIVLVRFARKTRR